MLQRTLSNKILPCLPKFLCTGYVNNFCTGSKKSNDTTSTPEKPENEEPKGDFKATNSTEELSRLLQESATYSDAKDTSWATTPYPKDAVIPDEKVERPKIDPLETSVVLFPGQGTIKVGAVKKYLRFPEAKELFEIANEILGYDLLNICLNGPQEKLDKTQFNQPATVVTSLAGLERLREERPKVFDTCVATAGYSVGELTSLIFSGAISFEDGIRLVSVRGQGMQKAADTLPQGMLSVYCTPMAKVSQACDEAQKWAQDLGVTDPVCKIAIYLCTQTKILAGNEVALQYIEKNSEKFGLSKLKRLPVSGAFHTPLMKPALKSFCKLLDTMEINPPRCRVYSNYTGTMYGDPHIIKKFLKKQIVSPVKWEQCMQLMYRRPLDSAFPRTFDVGSEGRMKTILKLINAKASNYCIVV